MNFFETLQQQDNVDITIRIMKKNDRLTLNVMPGSTNSTLKPILISGSGAELDELFFTTVFPAVMEVSGIISNIEDVKKEAQDLAESEKKKSVPKAEKKPELKKAEKKIPESKVEQPEMFG